MCDAVCIAPAEIDKTMVVAQELCQASHIILLQTFSIWDKFQTSLSVVHISGVIYYGTTWFFIKYGLI